MRWHRSRDPNAQADSDRSESFGQFDCGELRQRRSSRSVGRTETGLATTGRLAVALDVSPGTVTSMLKALSEAGLATYTPYEGVRLTDSGSAIGAWRFSAATA